jgi:hypothetical protein
MAIMQLVLFRVSHLATGAAAFSVLDQGGQAQGDGSKVEQAMLGLTAVGNVFIELYANCTGSSSTPSSGTPRLWRTTTSPADRSGECGRPAHLANMASVVVNGIVSEGLGAESVPDTKPQPELVIGLLAAPGPATELTESLVGEIADRLAGQLPGVRWRVEFVSDRLVQPPTDLSELIAAGRRMLLERGWHLAVCVTDLPLQTARRPVIAHVSATHGVAVLSMPALGPVSVRKRTAETIVRLAGHMLGDLAQAEGAAERLPLAEAVTRRMRELGARTERGEHGVGFVARVITGNVWLLLGMLRANRPWRLALRLMRVLAVAFAAGVFALVTSDIWRLAHYLGPLRLVAIGLGSVAAITVTIVVSTGLWEHSPHPAAREQVALFNIVTAATVGLGVAALYLALFIVMLAAALLLVPGSLLGLVLRHPAGVADQVNLAWLATSIATLGGALGAALESSESVREAAYTYQPDTQIDAVVGLQ